MAYFVNRSFEPETKVKTFGKTPWDPTIVWLMHMQQHKKAGCYINGIMSLKLSERRQRRTVASWGCTEVPIENVLPVNRASVPKPRGAQRTVLVPDRPQATPASPGLSQPLLPSTWSFLIAWGKTLVTTKQKASLSRPVWSASHNDTCEGRGQMKVKCCHKGRILITFSISFLALALGHHFHTASWGFQARTGEVCSGPENLSNCPKPSRRLPLAWPSLCTEASGTQLGSSPWQGTSNMDYIPPALDHCLWFMNLLHLFGIHLTSLPSLFFKREEFPEHITGLWSRTYFLYTKLVIRDQRDPKAPVSKSDVKSWVIDFNCLLLAFAASFWGDQTLSCVLHPRPTLMTVS